MAQPTTVNGSKLLIMLGDGNSPQTFVAPCGLTTKGINFAAASNEFNVPDCADPDAPMWTERVISALSAGVSGSGIMAMESYDEWRNWFLSGLSKSVHVSINEPLAAGGGYYSMRAILTGFNTTGNQGEKINLEVTIQSDGEVTWVPASS